MRIGASSPFLFLPLPVPFPADDVCIGVRKCVCIPTLIRAKPVLPHKVSRLIYCRCVPLACAVFRLRNLFLLFVRLIVHLKLAIPYPSFFL